MCFRHPDEKESTHPTIRAKVHCLGSVFYDIVACVKPYHGLKDHVILEHLQRGEYPNVTEVPLGNVMIRCWKDTFESAAEVV